MMRNTVIALLLVFSVVFGSSCAPTGKADASTQDEVKAGVQAQSNFPKSESFVNDFEQIFTADEVKQLNTLISDYEKQTTVQIAVVSLDDRYTNPDEFDNYTLGLANYWGLGVKGKDNGVLIAISSKFQIMRIQNGLGIEKILSDAETKQLIDDHFIPDYAKGAYFQGTLAGVKALIAALNTKKLP